ncbi:MAG: SHOCT domain-containing protein [Treponemataceae bacterium]
MAKKKQLEIVLKKEGNLDITVKCSEKIKLGWFEAFLQVQYGLPPLWGVKPIDWKGTGILLAAFFAIFVGISILGESNVDGIILVLFAIGMVILNLNLTKNYFFKFIQTKINEGYSVSDEQVEILEKAGITVRSGSFSAASTTNNTEMPTTKSVKTPVDYEELEKLSTLKEKGILTQEEFDAKKKSILGM